jgi:gliding motility-associated-like protein
MKSLLMRLGIVWIMLTSLLPTVFSQGVLVIEISDTLNTPLSGYSVRIKDANGTTKTYTTDSEGRVRDNNFPVGSYTYSFSYGDYNTGSFTVESGEPTWINLDYRRVAVNFKDEKGNPSSGNFVTLYKREADGSRTLVAQKTSGTNGTALFVVPEGNYTYVAADGEHDIVVADKNINTNVSVSSKLVTYKTSFRFVKGGKPISVYARDVNVLQYQNGYFRDFGIVLAHGDKQSNGYVDYITTDGKISCPVGEFKYSVYTRDYGTLEGTFYVTQKSSEANNIVDIVIPEKDPENNEDDLPIINPNDQEPKVTLSVFVYDCETGAPVQNIASRYEISGEGRSRFSTTNKNGYAGFSVNEGTYDVSIPGQTKENIYVNKDTTIEFCVSGPGITFQYIYFQFFYKGEEVFPQTISNFNIDKVENGSYLPYGTMVPTLDSISGLNKYKDPVITTAGRYYYSFHLEEYRATSKTGFFTTDTTKSIDTVKVVFEEKINVDIYVVHQDSTPANGSYSVTYIDKYKNNRRTDETGHLQLDLPPGEYTFTALDQTAQFELKNDTTLYFFLPNPDQMRNVYFKFLHDGEIVYPNVTTLSFFRDDNTTQYAYLSSTLYDNYEDIGRAYVFDKPIELPVDTFTTSYYIDDYEFDGQMYHQFFLNSSPNDTTIYIVVPVKRTVEIQIKDAKGANVQGVFAKIYKYNEEGELDPYLDYDGNSHSKLMSDATGIVRDHLVPGRYQIRILDIVRDFEVTDYDLRFTILSNVEMYNVKFTVLYSDDHAPVPNLKLDVKKGNEFYNSAITDGDGIIKFQSEAGNYSYTLYYGNGISDNYKIAKDEEFVIYVDRPILVNAIALIGGEYCLTAGESTKFTAIISPSNATQKNVEWSIDNNVIAKISSDGTLTANTLGLTGVVNLTAKAKDESGVSATVSVNISEEACVKSYTLAFGDGSTEMWLDDYSFDLVVTPSVIKKEYYGYQTSQDGIHWSSAADFTQEPRVTVNADRYMHNGTHYFRAVAADDAYDLLQILDGHVEPTPENMTNIIILHNYEDGRVITDKMEIPTVFTPHEVNGANDDFMPGYPVVIYNRFGDVICKSDNGWDGTYKGETADAGVYIYVLTMKDGTEKKGTIQLYRK